MNWARKWLFWLGLVSLAAGCASSGSDSSRDSASTYRSPAGSANYSSGGSCH